MILKKMSSSCRH